MGDIDVFKVKDLGEQALALLLEQFGPLLGDAKEKALPRLKVLGTQLAKYWILEARGAPKAAENLRWLNAELDLLLAEYAVKADAALRASASRWLNIAAKVGAHLLKVLL